MSDHDGFQYGESAFSDLVGLSRSDCLFLRKQYLVADRDWKKIGKEIALTQAGVVKLARAMTTRPETLNLSECSLVPQNKNGAPGEPLALEDQVSEGNPRELVVEKLWFNPRTLLASDPRTGEHLEVIVLDSRNFVVGMSLKAVPDERSQGYWRLLGPLPPRKGRWW